MISNYSDLEFIKSLGDQLDDLIIGDDSLSLLKLKDHEEFYLRVWLTFYDGNHYSLSRITKESLNTLLQGKIDIKSIVLNSDEIYYYYEPADYLISVSADEEFLQDYLPINKYYEDISS